MLKKTITLILLILIAIISWLFGYQHARLTYQDKITTLNQNLKITSSLLDECEDYIKAQRPEK